MFRFDTRSIDKGLRKYFWFIILFIVLLGFIFRLPGLASRSLWRDELYSAWFASLSFHDLWTELPKYETHPPLYYTLLKLWIGLFGDSEAGLRSLSLVASLATIATIGGASRFIKLGSAGDKASLLGALLLALNSSNIQQAQNARPYCLQAFAASVALLAGLRLVATILCAQEKPAFRDCYGPALLLGFASGLTMWLHNTGLFIPFGIWVGLAATLPMLPGKHRISAFALYFASGLLALLVWSPYLPIFLAQSKDFSSLSFWIKPRFRDLYDAWGLVIGPSIPALTLTFVTIVGGWIALYKREKALAIVVAATLLLPLYSILVISFSIKPIFIPRLFGWMVPASLMMISLAIFAIPRHRWFKMISVLALCGFSTARAVAAFSAPVEDWKGVVETIARQAEPNDIVIATPSAVSTFVKYYSRGMQKFPDILYVPGPYPARNLPRTYVSNLGSPVVTKEDGLLVDNVLQSHDRVWLIEVAPQLYDHSGIVASRVKSRRHLARSYGNELAGVQLFELPDSSTVNDLETQGKSK